MNVYYYDPDTFIFTGAEETYADPLEPHKYVKPEHATFTAVPTVPSGKQARFVSASDSWVLEDAVIPSASAAPTTTAFEDMTYQERLNYYGLGDLQAHIGTLSTVAVASTVQSQIEDLYDLLGQVKNDVNALNITKGIYGANHTLDDVDTRLTTLEGS